jgi:hypothetical protein
MSQHIDKHTAPDRNAEIRGRAKNSPSPLLTRPPRI